MKDIPCLLSFFAFEVHRHHAPCQILHALLVRQLGLGLAVQLPYLSAQRVFPLHLIGAAEVGSGGVVPPIREEGLAQQIFAGLFVLGRDIQLVSDVAVGSGDGGLTMRRGGLRGSRGT